MPVALPKIAKGEVGQTTVTANHPRSAFSSSVVFSRVAYCMVVWLHLTLLPTPYSKYVP